MKIKKSTDKFSSISEMITESRGKTVTAAESSFEVQMGKVQKEYVNNNIKDLIDEIVRQGDLLSKKADIKQYRVYKKLVSGFLDYIVSSSSEFCKKDCLDRRGTHRIYSVVKKINIELEMLASEVLDTQKGNLRIIERIVTIQGMILDMWL